MTIIQVPSLNQNILSENKVTVVTLKCNKLTTQGYRLYHKHYNFSFERAVSCVPRSLGLLRRSPLSVF